jgi:hypothetical protein
MGRRCSFSNHGKERTVANTKSNEKLASASAKKAAYTRAKARA